MNEERIGRIIEVVREAAELAGDSVHAFRRLLTERIEKGDLDDARDLFKDANQRVEDFLSTKK